jgi:hypothetical protein
MLHLHELVWLRENTNFFNVRDCIKNDSKFSIRRIQFLESTICQNVYENLTKLSSSSLSSTLIASINDVNDEVFLNLLKFDANHVVIKKNMHKHIATCQKYDKKECRFNFSRSLQFQNEIDEHEIIHLKKNHSYVNAFNVVIESCFRSNHDIQWIFINIKILNLLYYITNYVIKNDIFSFHILMKATLLKQEFDRNSRRNIFDDSNNKKRKQVRFAMF